MPWAPDDLAETLLRASHEAVGSQVDLCKLEGVPEPVAKYLSLSLKDGQPIIRQARYSQIGFLRTQPRSSRWFNFTANQLVVPAAHGFVWNARVRVAPFVHLQVRDALVDGRGSGDVRLLSAFKVAAAADTKEMNSGALHRYLAEAVWYPTALLPSDKLQWARIDSHKAMAILTHKSITVRLEFWFNDHGEATGIYTPRRWGRFGKTFAQAAWEGHFGRYERKNDMLIPMDGEVGWYCNDTWQSVWRGSLTDVTFQA